MAGLWDEHVHLLQENEMFDYIKKIHLLITNLAKLQQLRKFAVFFNLENV